MSIARAFPSGAHVAEVEIDRETGSVEVVEYTAVDDIGTVINPKLADANLLRASAGSLLRNVSNSISTGPSSASLGVLAQTQLGSGGTGQGASGSGGLRLGVVG